MADLVDTSTRSYSGPPEELVGYFMKLRITRNTKITMTVPKTPVFEPGNPEPVRYDCGPRTITIECAEAPGWLQE